MRFKTTLVTAFVLCFLTAIGCSKDDSKKDDSGTPPAPTPTATDPLQPGAKPELPSNNPGYCGYDFELETGAELEAFKVALGRQWSPAQEGSFSTEGGKDKKSERYYQFGFAVDFAAQIIRTVKLYHQDLFSNVITEVKDVQVTRYSQIYISKPHAVGERKPRLVVVETIGGMTKCQAQGFEVESAADADYLFITSVTGTSSYGDSIEPVKIEEFFAGTGLGRRYKIAKPRTPKKAEKPVR